MPNYFVRYVLTSSKNLLIAYRKKNKQLQDEGLSKIPFP